MVRAGHRVIWCGVLCRRSKPRIKLLTIEVLKQRRVVGSPRTLCHRSGDAPGTTHQASSGPTLSLCASLAVGWAANIKVKEVHVKGTRFRQWQLWSLSSALGRDGQALTVSDHICCMRLLSYMPLRQGRRKPTTRRQKHKAPPAGMPQRPTGSYRGLPGVGLGSTGSLANVSPHGGMLPMALMPKDKRRAAGAPHPCQTPCPSPPSPLCPPDAPHSPIIITTRPLHSLLPRRSSTASSCGRPTPSQGSARPRVQRPRKGRAGLCSPFAATPDCDAGDPRPWAIREG